MGRIYKLISVDGNDRIRVYLKEGKRGFNVGASYRKPGTGIKARTGMQLTFEHNNRAAADAYFDKIVADAVLAGWLPRGDDPSGSARRTAFTTIPFAPGYVAPVAEAADSAPAVVDALVEAEPVSKGSSRRK